MTDTTVSFWFANRLVTGTVTKVTKDASGAATFTVETDSDVFTDVLATSVSFNTFN